MIPRRSFFMGLVLAMAGAHFPARAALQSSVARAHVTETIDAILALIVANLPRHEIALRLKAIISARSALPPLARFTSGQHWSAMSADQKVRFTQALGCYLAHVYAGYFRAYEGSIQNLRDHVAIVGTEDAGAKGILVRSEIRPIGQVAVSVNWLVSDRSGRVAVSDLIVTGISMARTQRDVILAMFAARDGDAERMIADLEAETLRSSADVE